jgi:hypothetical protein
MKRHILPSLLMTVTLAVAVAACGDDTVDEGSSPSAETLPPVSPTDPEASDPTGGDGFEHPTGADEVVIDYSEVGGFVPMEVAFQSTPMILVSGGEQLFTPGMVPAIFPGPLLPAVQTQTISETGIQQLLAAADEAGLFADVVYDQPTNIADASTARVVINVNGETWVHEAYALGFETPGEEVSPERQALADFVEQLRTLAPVDPAELGDSAIYEATEYGIQAMPIDDLTAYGADGIEPTVIEWPADAGVALADATTCTVVAATGVGSTLIEADTLTFFDEDGTTYQVLAKPILPGTECGE